MKLRGYQEKCVERGKTYLKYPHRHPLYAIPTGGGKSLIIAALCAAIKEHDPDGKIIILSHVMEILDQNRRTIENHLGRQVGIISSGMGMNRMSDIVVAGIQSVWRKADSFSDFRHIIIDEAHSISRDQGTMYDTFFCAVPKAQRHGFTATPFRLGSGYIYGKDKQFTELAYDLTSAEAFVNLQTQGYLSKLVGKGTETKMDVEGIKILGGDFSEKELSRKFDKLQITNKAVDEIIARGADRKKWLIFAIDIDHAEHITEVLLRKGISANLVHSKMIGDRKNVLDGYKSGKFRAIVNVNVLTTGFDDPGIDLIALLRPTQSPVLHIQTIGRGLRIAENKADCLVLDFAGNLARLGPINDVKIVEKGKGAKGGECVMKECPVCSTMCYTSVRECPDCGHKFVFKVKLEIEAASDVIVAKGEKYEAIHKVTSVTYSKVERQGSPSMVKVTYLCGLKTFNEWLCVEHTGYAKTKADHFIKFRGGQKCNTADEALAVCRTLRNPTSIRVVKKGKFSVVEQGFFDQ